MEELKKNLTGSSFKLQQLVENCLQKFRQHEENDHVSFHLMDDLVSPLSIKGDGKSLSEVLELILFNSVSVVKATKINITLKQLLRTNDEILLEFMIENNGNKDLIDTGDLNCAYKKNLAIIQNSIEDLGGKTEISTLEGVGTTIKFLVKFFSEESLEQPGNSIPGKLAGKKILVAEDNEINQKIIVHLLKKENIDAEIANDGKEAIELFEQKQFDLVLLDLQMPHMDGFQTAKYIRKILASDVPIVAMTAGAFANEQTRCFEIGINQYLSKPFTAEDLYQRLKYLLLNEHHVKHKKKAQPAIAKALYNLEPLRQSSDEDLVEILEMFISKTPALIGEIKHAVETKEFSTIMKKTAKLRGSLGSLQMQTMIKIVEEIEALARISDVHKFSQQMEKLQAEYYVIAPLLEKELSEVRVKI
jgi:CheY-like chemotaxis protein